MNNRDWTGDSNSIYKTLGASNHTDGEREENDLYCTDPKAVDLLCSVEEFDGVIWECAAGLGHMSDRLTEHGYNVLESDIYRRGRDVWVVDFLKHNEPFDGNIVTNPPYSKAKEFVEHALELIPDGKKVAMFLRLLFLESKGRKPLFEKYPPQTVYVLSSRIMCAKNGDFDATKKSDGGAMAFAWLLWQKGDYSQTILKWIN